MHASLIDPAAIADLRDAIDEAIAAGGWPAVRAAAVCAEAVGLAATARDLRNAELRAAAGAARRTLEHVRELLRLALRASTHDLVLLEEARRARGRRADEPEAERVAGEDDWTYDRRDLLRSALEEAVLCSEELLVWFGVAGLPSR